MDFLKKVPSEERDSFMEFMYSQFKGAKDAAAAAKPDEKKKKDSHRDSSPDNSDSDPSFAGKTATKQQKKAAAEGDWIDYVSKKQHKREIRAQKEALRVTEIKRLEKKLEELEQEKTKLAEELHRIGLEITVKKTNSSDCWITKDIGYVKRQFKKKLAQQSKDRRPFYAQRGRTPYRRRSPSEDDRRQFQRHDRRY